MGSVKKLSFDLKYLNSAKQRNILQLESCLFGNCLVYCNKSVVCTLIILSVASKQYLTHCTYQSKYYSIIVSHRVKILLFFFCKMALIIGHSQVKYLHEYIQDPRIVTLSYPGSRVDQLWPKLEDIVPAFEVSTVHV